MNDEAEEYRRPNPQRLLKLAQRQEAQPHKGKLKIFMGMSAGVGKTYAMLLAGAQQLKKGVDVLVGVVETHGRKETAELLKPLPQQPLQAVEYRGAVLREFDLPAMLRRKPSLALVDELAHSNVPGSRHKKRYQDVLELLDAGIDVYTTLNIQHVESRKDIIEGITGTVVQETVPDMMLEIADEIQLIDISPTQLMQRLKEGKVYLGKQPQIALQNFFKEENITALREIALRYLAEQVDSQLSGLVSYFTHERFHSATENLLVAVSPEDEGESLVRATKRLAHILNARWVAVWVDLGYELSSVDKERLARNLALAGRLGAEVITSSATEFVEGLSRSARQVSATKIIMGRPPRISLYEYLTGGSVLDKLAAQVSDVDLYILRRYGEKSRPLRPFFLLFSFPTAARAYFYAGLFVVALTALSYAAMPWLGYRAVGFIFLLGVLLLSLWTEGGPILMAATTSALIWNFFFMHPIHAFNLRYAEDIGLIGIYFIVAIITGILVGRVRHSHRKLLEQEKRTHYLYEALKAISETRDLQSLKRTLLPILAQAVDGTFEILVAKDSKTPQLSFVGSTLSQKEESVADWVINKRKPAGWSTDTLASSERYFLPLLSYDSAVGVLCLRPGNPKKTLDIGQINLLQTIAKPLAIFIERRLRDNEKAKASYDLQIDNIKKMMDQYVRRGQSAFPSVAQRPRGGPMPSIALVKPSEGTPSIYTIDDLVARATEAAHESEQPLDFLIDNRCGEVNLALDLDVFGLALRNMLVIAAEAAQTGELLVVFNIEEGCLVIKVQPKVSPLLTGEERPSWDQFLETKYATQLAILHALAANQDGAFKVEKEGERFLALSLTLPLGGGGV